MTFSETERTGPRTEKKNDSKRQGHHVKRFHERSPVTRQPRSDPWELLQHSISRLSPRSQYSILPYLEAVHRLL